MIVETEIVEQLAEENWRLDCILDFVEEFKEPWTVLEALYKNNYIKFVDNNSKSLPSWKVEKIFREKIKNIVPVVFVAATEEGLNHAHI
jgi:hypothetical protein